MITIIGYLLLAHALAYVSAVLWDVMQDMPPAKILERSGPHSFWQKLAVAAATQTSALLSGMIFSDAIKAIKEML